MSIFQKIAQNITREDERDRPIDDRRENIFSKIARGITKKEEPVIGDRLSEEQIRGVHDAGFHTIGPARPETWKPREPERERTITERLQEHQEVWEERTGIGQIRVPFSIDRTFRPPTGHPVQGAISTIAARAPELIGRFPIGFTNFFRKNVGALAEYQRTGDASKMDAFETKQFETFLGFDVRRFGVDPDELMLNSVEAALQQIEIEQRNNPDRSNFYNTAVGVTKTVVSDTLDVLIPLSLGTQAVKGVARTLPNDVLFKMHQQNVSPVAIRDVLIGGKKMSSIKEYKLAVDFVDGLTAEGRKELFNLVNIYKGSPHATAMMAQRTALGRFADAPIPGGMFATKPVVPKGLLPSPQAGFINPMEIGKGLVNLAQKSKDFPTFTKSLTKDQLAILTAKGVTPQTFFESVKGADPALFETPDMPPGVPTPTPTPITPPTEPIITISKGLEPLAKEARKYDSPEDFMASVREGIKIKHEDLPTNIQDAKRDLDKARRVGALSDIHKAEEKLGTEINKVNRELSQEPLSPTYSIKGPDVVLTATDVEALREGVYEPRILDTPISEIRPDEIPGMIERLESIAKEKPPGVSEVRPHTARQQIQMLREMESPVSLDDLWREAKGLPPVRPEPTPITPTETPPPSPEPAPVTPTKPTPRAPEPTPVTPPAEYRGMHEAPTRFDDAAAPAHKLDEIYPKDIYSPDAARLYSTGVPYDAETINILQGLRGKPGAKLTVYRAIPGEKTNAEMIEMYEKQKLSILKTGKIPDQELADSYNLKNSSEYYDFIDREIERLKSFEDPVIEKPSINEGDWVTVNRKYAKGHGESELGGNYKIISKEVRADELFTDANSIHEFGYSPKVSPEISPEVSRVTDINYERKKDLLKAFEKEDDIGLFMDEMMDEFRALGYDTTKPAQLEHQLRADVEETERILARERPVDPYRVDPKISPVARSGEEVAREVQEMGSDQEGISDFLYEKIRKENYITKTEDISSLRKTDKDLDEYLKTAEIREFEGEPFAMDPVVSSGGEVLDGYNRIAQALVDGETKISILKGETGVPVEPEITTDAAVTKKINEDLERVESEVLIEMEMAEAGKRIIIDVGDQVTDPNIIGQPSTFPRWVPTHLRERDLFDKVMDHIRNKTIPPDRFTKQKELYEVAQDEMGNRLDKSLLEEKEMIEIAKQSPIKAGIIRKLIPPSAQRILGIKPSPFVVTKKREYTLLKERIKNVVRGAREGALLTRREIAKAQKDLRNIIKESELPAKQRDKFEAQIRNIAKAKDPQARLESVVPVIEARIAKISQSLDVDAIRADITKTLKRFTPKKVDGILKGKLTAEGQEQIEIIRGALNQTPEDALEKLSQNLQALEKGVDPTMEAKLILENEILGSAGSLVSKNTALDAGMGNLSLVKQRLDEIITDPKIGLTERARIAINEEEELNRLRGHLTEDVTLSGSKLDTAVDSSPITESKFQKAKGRVMQYIDHNVNNLDFWAAKADSYYADSVPMRADLAPRGWWKQTRKLQEADRSYIQEEEIGRNLAGSKLAEVYKLKGDIDKWKLEGEMNKKINLGDFKLRTGETKNITMTRHQLMAKYAQLQQEAGIIRLTHGNQWTDEIIDAVYKNILPEDKKVVWKFINEFYPQIKEAANPIHQKFSGISIGEEVNYSPMPTKYGEDLPDQLRISLQEFQRRSTSPGAVKARVDLKDVKDDAVVAPLEFDDFFMTARKHLMDMKRYQTFTEPIREMRRLLTGDTRKALVQRFGRHFPQEMDKLLDQLASGAMRDTKNMSALWKVRSNFTTSVFALSPTRLFKEATSSVLWALELNPLSLSKSSTELFAKNLYRKTGQEMWDLSARLRERGTRRTYDRDLSINADNKTALKLFTDRQGAIDKSLIAQKAGDKFGIYSFGIPYYHHHKMRLIKSGVPEQEAKEKAIRFFEEAFKRNQVSGQAIDLGQFQRVGEMGPFFSQFKTSMLGLLRQELHAMRSLGLKNRIGFKDAPRPKESILKNLAKIALIHAQFMLFQWVADGFRVDPERQKRAGLLGPFGAPLMIGDGLETVVRIVTGDDVFDRGAITAPGLSRVRDVFYRGGLAIKNLIDGETGYGDLFESIIDLALSTGDLLGVPATNLRNLGSSGYQGARGELTDWRELIWSDYSLDIDKPTPVGPPGVMPGVDDFELEEDLFEGLDFDDPFEGVEMDDLFKDITF